MSSNEPTGNFNHKALFVTHSNLIKEISMRSKEGWEVVSASPLPNSTAQGYSVLLVLRKPMFGGMSVNDVRHLKKMVQLQMETLKDEQEAKKVDISIESMLLFQQNLLDFIGR